MQITYLNEARALWIRAVPSTDVWSIQVRLRCENNTMGNHPVPYKMPNLAVASTNVWSIQVRVLGDIRARLRGSFSFTDVPIQWW